MDRIAFKAEFARNVDKAHSIMANMRVVAAMGAYAMEESRKRIQESWTFLKQPDED